MENIQKSPMAQLLTFIGKTTAIIMIIRYVLLIVNSYYPFLPNGVVMDILNYINIYAPIILMVAIALSIVWDKSEILKFIMVVVCSLVVICCFFPDVRNTLEQFAGISQVA